MPMAKKTNPSKPTELELSILKVLWNADSQSLPMAVRDIRTELASIGRELAHTSVITILNIMVDKKFLRRKKIKNAFYFSPIQRQESVQSNMLADIVTRVFDGSAQSLMVALLDQADVSASELKQLQKLIREKAKQESE
jgi:BlaI family penicillinase repressor